MLGMSFVTISTFRVPVGEVPFHFKPLPSPKDVIFLVKSFGLVFHETSTV